MVAFRYGRLAIGLVHHRDVVEDIALIDQHLAHAGIDDDRHFACEGGIPGLAVRNRGRHQMAAAVLVLQAFAAQRRAPRGGADQEAAGTLVGCRPDLIADPLKAEHRVINIEGQHGQSMHAVAGGCGRPAGECAGFADPFFEDLSVGGLAIAEHRADVLWRIALSNA